MVDQTPCKLCGRTRDEHGGLAHAFQTVYDRLEKAESPRQIESDQLTIIPGDPVLRFILIQKGLITPEELTETEKVLRATGLLQTEVPDAGDRANGDGDREGRATAVP